MVTYSDYDQLEVIAPNFKRRLSGVTSTIIQLVPAQAAAGTGIATLGTGLPDHLPKLRKRDLWRLWKRPADGRSRIWHARRNTEMIAGIVARNVLRMPLKLLFTSAAQRHHKRFTKWLIKQMNAVIATSARSGAYLEVPHEVIMHGIDTDRFVEPHDKCGAKRAVGLDPDRKTIGCTGRIRPSKGTDLLVDALIALLPDRPEWDAIITGRATSEFAAFKADLESRVAGAGLSDRIRFVGEVEDILPWYQAFDLFVAPSRKEGFGLTPLEAMACGVPCVTSDAGSYAEMVEDDVTGLVVAAGDGEVLREAISTAMDGGLGGTDRARDTVIASFSLHREVQQIAQVYQGLRGATAP